MSELLRTLWLNLTPRPRKGKAVLLIPPVFQTRRQVQRRAVGSPAVTLPQGLAELGMGCALTTRQFSLPALLTLERTSGKQGRVWDRENQAPLASFCLLFCN